MRVETQRRQGRRKVFHIVRVLEDAIPCSLAFANMRSAVVFADFLLSYQKFSSAGNGYGAYWLVDRSILRGDTLFTGVITELNTDLIFKMAQRIVEQLSCGEGFKDGPRITIGKDKGAIIFSFSHLPPFQRPTVGDVCRVIGEIDEKFRGYKDFLVIEDLGGVLRVLPRVFKKRGDDPLNPDMEFEVKPSEVVKVKFY